MAHRGAQSIVEFLKDTPAVSAESHQWSDGDFTDFFFSPRPQPRRTAPPNVGLCPCTDKRLKRDVHKPSKKSRITTGNFYKVNTDFRVVQPHPVDSTVGAIPHAAHYTLDYPEKQNEVKNNILRNPKFG